MILTIDEKDQPSEWIIPTTVGQQPAPRYAHTMVYYNGLNSLVIYGGKNELTQQILSDLWLLTLNTLTWIKADVRGDVSRSRYHHCSEQVETQLFIFGGIQQNQYSDHELYRFELGEFSPPSSSSCIRRCAPLPPGDAFSSIPLSLCNLRPG